MAKGNRQTPSRKAFLEARRRRRRRRALIVASVFVVCASIFLFGIAQLFALRQLEVKEVYFDSLYALSEGDLRNAVDMYLDERLYYVIPKNNIFFANTKQLSSLLLEKFPRIASATVEKNIFSRSLFITVHEHMLWALLCKIEPPDNEHAEDNQPPQIENNTPQTDEDCYSMSEDGIVFGKAPQFRGTLITKVYSERLGDITLGTQTLPDSSLRLVRVFVLASEQFPEITHLRFLFELKDNKVTMNTGEGWNVYLYDDNSPEHTLDNLLLSLREEIKEKRTDLEYIDLRFGDKAYYKLK